MPFKFDLTFAHSSEANNMSPNKVKYVKDTPTCTTIKKAAQKCI